MYGAAKYSDFAAVLPISNSVLTGRLELLVREGLFERRVYQSNPVRASYELTPRGRSTWPVLVAIWAWERRWVAEHAFSTPPMIHRSCGVEMSPTYCCSSCHVPVRPSDVTAAWGPSGGWARSVPVVSTRRRSDLRSTTVKAGHFYPDTMAVFGNRWSSAVVGAAFRGVRRFKDFEDLLGVPPSLLASRLASLCERGILHQVSLQTRPDWAEYRLTDKGLDVFPVIGAVIAWAERWYGSPEGPVLELTHTACGVAFKGELVCDQCGTVLRAVDIDLGQDG